MVRHPEGLVNKRILCIDDEASGLAIRSMLLRREGYEVISALNGPEGLDLFAFHQVDAVVVDYSMPGMNGGEVAAELKRRKPAVKILLFSAFVDLPEAALRWVDRRAVKGVSPVALLADLREMLSQ
jgi:CheY-like chemotaxis protein